MSVTLQKLTTNTATVTLDVGEDTLTVRYYPARVTEKVIATVQGFANLAESQFTAAYAEVNAILCTLVKSWDLYEDEAQTQMYPLDASRLADLPVMFRAQVLTAILSDMRPEADAP